MGPLELEWVVGPSPRRLPGPGGVGHPRRANPPHSLTAIKTAQRRRARSKGVLGEPPGAGRVAGRRQGAFHPPGWGKSPAPGPRPPCRTRHKILTDCLRNTSWPPSTLARSVPKVDQPAAFSAGNPDAPAESIGPPPPDQEIANMTNTRKIAWLALPLCCLLTAPSMAAGLDDGLPGLDVRREDRQADRQLDRRADRQLLAPHRVVTRSSVMGTGSPAGSRSCR